MCVITQADFPTSTWPGKYPNTVEKSFFQLVYDIGTCSLLWQIESTEPMNPPDHIPNTQRCYKCWNQIYDSFSALLAFFRVLLSAFLSGFDFDTSAVFFRDPFSLLWCLARSAFPAFLGIGLIFLGGRGQRQETSNGTRLCVGTSSLLRHICCWTRVLLRVRRLFNVTSSFVHVANSFMTASFLSSNPLTTKVGRLKGQVTCYHLGCSSKVMKRCGSIQLQKGLAGLVGSGSAVKNSACLLLRSS